MTPIEREFVVAVGKKNNQRIKEIVEDGFDARFQNDYALRWSAEYSNIEIIKYLVGKGCDIHAEDDSIFRRALHRNDYDLLEYLSCFNMNFDMSFYENRAIRHNDERMIKILTIAGRKNKVNNI
jgi:hypothetical protein